MKIVEKTQTRKTFIGFGITAAALFTVFRFFIPEKKNKPVMVKMLTQDGKLIEVDAQKLIGTRKKMITDEKLKTWVIPKQDKVSG